MIGLIRNWSGVLGKAARCDNRERLEDLSEQPVDFGEVDSLVGCRPLRELMNDMVQDAKRGQAPTQQDLAPSPSGWLAVYS